MGKQNLTTERGFTLTEVMTVLAVTAISVTLAVPMMNNLITGNDRSTLNNELISTMHAARSQAITRNQQVTVCTSADALTCTDTNWHQGLIWFVDENQDRQPDQNEKLLGSLDSFEQTTIVSREFENFLVFRPNGKIMVESIADNSGAMLICDHRNSENNRILVLNTIGKPQLFNSENPADYTDCDLL